MSRPRLGTRSANSTSEIRQESDMLASATSLTVDPMFLRHDLLIELGRLELAIHTAADRQPANDHDDLQQRYATIRQTLSRICA